MQASRQDMANQTRHKIIEAAFDIVGNHGYPALTSNELVRVAGVAKGTLYHHFSTMDDVIIGLMDFVIEMYLECVPLEGFKNFKEYTTALGEFQQQSFTEDSRLTKVVYGYLPIAMSNPKFRQPAKDMLSHAISKMTPVIRNFFSEDLSDDQIETAIRMIDMFSLGYGVHQNFFNDPEKHLEIWNQFFSFLDSYLSNTELTASDTGKI
jgi:AcrR family transcriptional regulator